jgi:hypothetical protein
MSDDLKADACPAFHLRDGYQLVQDLI